MDNFLLKNDRKFGFTLVELIVSVGVFSVISTIAIGGFINALRTHRQAMALMTANSNTSAAIEQIAREIRTGKSFTVSGQSNLSFENAAGNNITYDLIGDSLTISENNDPAQKITDENVLVKYLSFRIINNIIPLVNYPSRIVINIGVAPRDIKTSVKNIDIQTVVSTRNE
ncbi:MAG: prepilin-type N-terminal cleavage/methylation domain-containing protein [Patescibacteria group bacterium]